MSTQFAILCLLAVSSIPVFSQFEARQDAYIKSSSPCPCGDDEFGCSVALSYPWAVVGHRFEDSDATGVDGDGSNENQLDSGAAWVYFHDGLEWTEHSFLKPSNTGGRFGESVAIDGDTIVVGCPGDDSNTTGVNGDDADTSSPSSGAVFVFVRDAANKWSQQAYLKASNSSSSDEFGKSVAISGDTVLVGADRESSNATGVDGDQSDTSLNSAGAAYVFHRDSSAMWSQQAYLKASNTTEDDNFGYSVSLDGDVAVVGAYNEDSGGMGVNPADTSDSTVHSDSGAAYIYSRTGTTWTFRAHLKSAAPEDGGGFGYSTAVSGDTIAIGARSEVDEGRVYVFVRSGATYVGQAILSPPQADSDQRFGESVSLSGPNLLVGAPGDAVDKGLCYLFRRNGTNSWVELIQFEAGNANRGDLFGAEVAIDDFRAFVGAYREDSVSIGIDSVPLYNSGANVGAAYAFSFTRPLEILNCSHDGKAFQITFLAEPSLTGWELHGGSNLELSSDHTAEAVFEEVATGRYQASFVIDPELEPNYFFRITRDE